MQSQLLILIVFLLGLSQESLAQYDCHVLFERQKTSKEKIEDKLNTRLEVFLRLDHQDSEIRDYSIRIRDGHEVYSIALFSYYEDISGVEVIQMKVYSGYNRLGLGSLMMEEIIKALPEARVIIVRGLKGHNLEVVEKHLALGLTQIEAIKKTPAYKIRAKLGFTEIIPGSVNDHDGFTVRKRILKD